LGSLAHIAVPIVALWFGVLTRCGSDFFEGLHLPHTDLAPE